MLRRVLIAMGFLVLGSASAFAAVCTVPTAGLPTGQTFATTNTSGGTLNGYANPLYPGNSAGWETCTASGASYVAYNSDHNTVFTSNAYIPFAPSVAEWVTISVSELTETGNTFTLYVDNNYVSGTTGTSLVVDITNTTLNVLGIAETYGGGHTYDDFSVSITKYNYIPEPATITLLGFGVACLITMRRRQNRST